MEGKVQGYSYQGMRRRYKVPAFLKKLYRIVHVSPPSARKGSPTAFRTEATERSFNGDPMELNSKFSNSIPFASEFCPLNSLFQATAPS